LPTANGYERFSSKDMFIVYYFNALYTVWYVQTLIHLYNSLTNQSRSTAMWKARGRKTNWNSIFGMHKRRTIPYRCTILAFTPIFRIATLIYLVFVYMVHIDTRYANSNRRMNVSLVYTSVSIVRIDTRIACQYHVTI
jgi:hypothetical protein